jgi:hypothetical protein
MIDLEVSSRHVILGTSAEWWQPANAYGQANYLCVRDAGNSYFYDPLSEFLSHVEFRSPSFSILENMGFDEPPSIAGSIQLGFPPSGDDFPSRLDKLYTIAKVNRFLTGTSTDKVDTNEHGISHVNLKGTVREGCVPVAQVGGPFGSKHTWVTIDPDTLTFSFSGTSSYHPLYRDYELKTFIEAGLESGSFWYTVDPGINVGIKDVSYHHDNEGNLMGLSYTLVNSGWGLGPENQDGITPYLAYKEVRVGFGFVWQVFSSSPSSEAEFWTRYAPCFRKGIRTIRQYSREQGEAPVWHVGQSFGPNPMGYPNAYHLDQYQCWAVVTPPTYWWEAYSGLSGINGYRKVDSGPTSFVRFRRDLRSITSDLFPLAYQAQGDAYDTSIGTIKSNLLEFLFELGDVASLLDSPLNILDSLRRVHKTPYSLFKAFLDDLSDATLFYSFMLSPSVRLAEEMADKAKELSQSFDVFFGYQTVNGEAGYEIGDELPDFTGCIVTGRAKMRVRVPADTLWSVLLPLDRLNLLPSFSNYWETIRLGFLIDWFFNIQSKLNVIDNTIKFLALDMGQTVNSVTLYKPIIPSGPNASFVVDEGTSYVYYCRYVLPTFQSFTPTRLNILGGQGVPNWLVAGSLFYKLS